MVLIIKKVCCHTTQHNNTGWGTTYRVRHERWSRSVVCHLLGNRLIF